MTLEELYQLPLYRMIKEKFERCPFGHPKDNRTWYVHAWSHERCLYCRLPRKVFDDNWEI
jgi:hypothetical protein